MTKKLLVFVVMVVSGIQAFTQAAHTSSDPMPFAPPVGYAAGNAPYSVFCADLDGDLDLDLAVANSGYPGLQGSVSILKNNGDGTFQPKVDYTTGLASTSIFCADLDGDLDLDLAVANQLSHNVSILMNNGDGTFQPKVDYGAGSGAFSVFCADLDGDSDLDLAVANFWSDDVWIFMNNGHGVFELAYCYAVGDRPVFVSCADLDGDSDSDLAVAVYNSDNISILKNNGDGTFQTKVDYLAGDGPRYISCADLDGDSDMDLAVANEQGGDISVFKNNGDGTFALDGTYSGLIHPSSVFCSDLDGDSDFDLAVGNWDTDSISVFLNEGNGIFAVVDNYEVGSDPYAVYCADLDADLDPDLVVARGWTANSVSILLNLRISVGSICDAFLTPKRLAIHDTRLFRAAPRNQEIRNRNRHSFKIHLLPCDPMDVSVGDSAEVFVDVDASGEFDNDEQYPAVVSSTDRDGEATDIAIKVFVGGDLIDNDPLVAVYTVGGQTIVDVDGNPIDYLQLDTFTPGRGGMAAGEGLVPMDFILDQNYPNPFNANTAIRFSLPTPSQWTLSVYNVAGQLIEDFRGSAESGFVTVNWDATDVASGIYFYKLIAGDFAETRKMILMK